MWRSILPRARAQLDKEEIQNLEGRLTHLEARQHEATSNLWRVVNHLRQSRFPHNEHLIREIEVAVSRLERVPALADAGSTQKSLNDVVQILSARRLKPFRYLPTGGANPFMRALYDQAPDNGFEVQGIPGLRALRAERAQTILHVHWLQWLQDRSIGTAEAAQRRADELLGEFDRVTSGGHLIWTIHEPLPLEMRFPDAEIRFRAELAKRATVIHTLTPGTVASARRHFPIDLDKVVSTPQPTYQGLVPPKLAKTRARAMLGCEPDDVVVLIFGNLWPYKRVALAAELAQMFGDRHRVRVRTWIVGRPSPDIDVSDDLAAAEAAGATVLAAAVSDYAVAALFSAADIALIAYDETAHNSAVAHLALSMRCAVVMPRTAVSEGYAQSGKTHLFDPKEPATALDAMAMAVATTSDADGQLDQYLDAHAPSAVSAQFFAALADAGICRAERDIRP